MADKNKLQKILTSLSRPDVRDAFKSVEKEMQKVAEKLKQDAEFKTVEIAKKRITEIKAQIQSIFDYLNTLKGEIKKSEDDLNSSLNQKLDALKSRMAEYRTASLERLGMLSAEMDDIKSDIRDISQRKVEIPNFEDQISKVESELGNLILGLKEETEGKIEEILKESKKTISNLEEELKKLRRDTMSAMASRGGGNMNRNILVAGNPSTLGRYTDLNIKAGANVTLTYVNNDALKTTDLTIASSGQGGSVVGGTVRSINTISTSQTIASVVGTDYVYIASAGIKITMPPDVATNTNLYTVKNISTSSVLVVPNGAEKIDAQSTIILATQYTAIDLISDTSNWNIT